MTATTTQGADAGQTEPWAARRLSTVEGWDFHRANVSVISADGTRTVHLRGDLPGHPDTTIVFAENVDRQTRTALWGKSGPFRLSDAEQAALLPVVWAVTADARSRGAGDYRISR